MKFEHLRGWLEAADTLVGSATGAGFLLVIGIFCTAMAGLLFGTWFGLTGLLGLNAKTASYTLLALLLVLMVKLLVTMHAMSTANEASNEDDNGASPGEPPSLPPSGNPDQPGPQTSWERLQRVMSRPMEEYPFATFSIWIVFIAWLMRR